MWNMKDWNFLLNIWTRDWVRAIRSSSVFFLLVRKQTKHGINLYSYNIVLATHWLFFFFLPHNSVVISMLRNKTWNHVCVILYWFHSIWGCCFIIGWMDCPSCPWPVSCKVFCFVLKILLRLQKHNCFLPIQYLQYSVIQCICSEYLTKMSKTLLDH